MKNIDFILFFNNKFAAYGGILSTKIKTNYNEFKPSLIKKIRFNLFKFALIFVYNKKSPRDASKLEQIL